MIFVGIAAIVASALAGVGAAPAAPPERNRIIIQRAGLAAAGLVSIDYRKAEGLPITYAAYMLRRPVVVGKRDSIALVTTRTLDFRAPFRLPSNPGLLATSEKTAGVEWLHGNGWAVSAGYASTKPARMFGRFDQASGTEPNNFRSAKGLRIAAELLPGGQATPRQFFGLDARLQRVRIQDTALIGAGEKLGEARLALVFKRSW